MNSILESVYPDKEVVARRQASGLPPLVPRIDLFSAYLHEEMRQCYLNGHDHASIVLACAFIESTLKDAIYLDEFVKADCVFDRNRWDKIDGMKFGPAVNVARSRGVVTKKEWDQLDWLRKQIRIVYMHGQTPHWIKDKDDTIVEVDMATGEAKEVTVMAGDNIVLQRFVRIAADRNVCDTVVRLVDALARIVTQRRIKALQEWKDKNVPRPTSAQVERVLESMRKEGLEPEWIVASDLPSDLPPPTAKRSAGS